jgi:hypothetical protein
MSDSATATLTDVASGESVGTVSATDLNVPIQTGTQTDSTIDVTDVERLVAATEPTPDTPTLPLPAGISFKVSQTSGPGSFSGYTADTYTTGDVNWGATGLTDTGSAVFLKTVKVLKGYTPNAALYDRASFTGSDGATGTATASVSITSSRTVSLEIDKTIPASIGSDVTFTFTVTGPNSYSSTQTVTITAGNTSGSKTVTGLAPGSYTTHEETPPSPFVAAPNVTTNLSAQGTCSGTAEFDNTFGPAHLRVTKTLNGSTDLAGNTFTFELRQGVVPPTGGGTLLETETISQTSTCTGVTGPCVDFTRALDVGNTYTLCEFVMPGWSTNLPNLPNQYSLTLGDNNVRVCTNFTVTNAQADTIITANVDNTPPPGGAARTIGFWKNWSSCGAKGHQAPVLDQTLVKADTFGGLVVSATGGSWPTFTGTILVLHSGDCVKAVELLSKTDFTGVRRASDPLFNMTAQLVAAELNYFAGAGQPANTTSNINKAVKLDGKYNFNGFYPYTPTLSPADKLLAACLNTQLDNYNNNNPASAC